MLLSVSEVGCMFSPLSKCQLDMDELRLDPPKVKCFASVD